MAQPKPEPMKTSLSIPSVQPKPTKTEVLDAMVIRAKVKHDAENKRREKAREALEKKITALAIKAGKSKTPSVGIYVYNNKESNHCDLYIRNLQTPELQPLLEDLHSLIRLVWDEKDVRRAIKQELSGIAKPSPTRLLDNPETVKAMDAMLAQWGM